MQSLNGYWDVSGTISWEFVQPFRKPWRAFSEEETKPTKLKTIFHFVYQTRFRVNLQSIIT